GASLRDYHLGSLKSKQPLPILQLLIQQRSHSQLLEVAGNARCQRSCLFIQALQIDVKRAQRLLEIEPLVLLLRSHADIAAWGQAPVVRLDDGAIDELRQSFDIAQLRVRESFLKSVGLSYKIPRSAQHLDRRRPRYLKRLARPRNIGIGPKAGVSRLQLLHA